MAHFAELDINNIVIKVHTACNIDIQNNGGELSEQAAKHFEKTTPLSSNGVKYVQTSYNNNFRKKYAAIDDYYDPIKDKFIIKRPYPSWTLDNNDDWKSPVNLPNSEYQKFEIRYIKWNENFLRWEAEDLNKNLLIWTPSSLSWTPAIS
jgi:hypothetical protein